jgi:menaquinone-dependent protoporphyrinogen oxidase
MIFFEIWVLLIDMKALVVYGSRWGGTVAVAQKIAVTLRNEDLLVDAVDAKKVSVHVEDYDLIIIGSGIRADKWTKETLAFLKSNIEILKTKKTALFVSCQMADRPEKAVYGKAKNQYLNQTAEQFGIEPVSYGFFGGFMDFSQSHGLIVDIMVRVNRKSLAKNGLDTTKVHDTRNWSEIEVWARELAKSQ